MAERVYVDKQYPEAFRALGSLVTELGRTRDVLGATLVELVNVRVSQMNGCAFCLELHTRRALDAGEDPRRLAVLPAWREVDGFTDTERAALRLAEIVTSLPDHFTADLQYREARTSLTDEQVAQVVWTAIAINAFNRVSILSRHPVDVTPRADAPS